MSQYGGMKIKSLKNMLVSMFLICCMLSVTFLAVGVQSASAANYGAGVFCPNNWQPATFPNGAGDTPRELEISQEMCQLIYNYLNSYYDGTCYYYYGSLDYNQSPRNPAVTGSTYNNTLRTLEQNNNKVALFSKGHCTPWGNSNHYKLMGTEDTEAAKDNDIFLATNKARTQFAFIWHCGTALSYPVAAPYQDAYGYIGLPLAFTHNTAMTKYGTSGQAMYLGWIYRSPQFNDDIPQNTAWKYANFAEKVYWFMHKNPTWSLQYTLNYLSNAIYGKNFNQCPLYNDLIVWGNMNLTISY
jgi:hypothetical protein